MVKTKWIQEPIVHVYNKDNSQSTRHAGCGAALDAYTCPTYTAPCDRRCDTYNVCSSLCSTRDSCTIHSCGSQNCSNYSCGILIG